MQRERSLVVVAGSGRSGTSLCSTLLHRLGFHIPQPEVQANRNNPRGYGEPRWAVDFHQRWLDERDVSKEDARPRAIAKMERLSSRPKPPGELRAWLTEQFDVADHIVVKDPRLTWFTGLYSDAAAALGVRFGVITMLRHPVETTRSRETAYGDSLSDITRITAWVNMMLSVEHATRSMPRTLLRYDDLVADWRGAILAADEIVGPGLVAGASDEQVAAADDLVDPSLRRSIASWEEYDVPPELRRLAEAAHEALEALAARPPGASANDTSLSIEQAQQALDGIRADYAVYYGHCEQVARTSAVAVRRDQKRKDAEVIRRLERELRQTQRAVDPPAHRERSLVERVKGRLRRLGRRADRA